MLSFKRPLMERRIGSGADMTWKPRGWQAGGGRGQGTRTGQDGGPEGWEAEGSEDGGSLQT